MSATKVLSTLATGFLKVHGISACGRKGVSKEQKKFEKTIKPIGLVIH